MKKIVSLMMAVCFVLTLGFTGCGQQAKSQTSKEAIETAKTMESVEKQVNFLVKEANGFISSEKFDEAIATAKYILSNLDKDSQEAKSLLTKAQEKLKEYAAQKAEEMKGELKKKINFGDK